MTNVKLIIYLSQSHTLNLPRLQHKQTFYLFTSRNSFMSQILPRARLMKYISAMYVNRLQPFEGIVRADLFVVEN